MKTISVIILVVLVVGGGLFFWQQRQSQQSAASDEAASTVEPTPTPIPRTVTISQPVDGATLVLGETATVSGQAVGLFEGNIVIRLADSMNKVVLETPITVTDWMQEGPVDWTTEITVPAEAVAGLSELTAINPSAKDPSEDVSATVSITLAKPSADAN